MKTKQYKEASLVMIRSRPKRTVSNNVDYNLKKRKIIKEGKNSESIRKTKATPPLQVKCENENQNGSTDTDAGEDVMPVLRVQESGNMVFYEPRISEPINGVTGAPLNELPNDKVKKEALWNIRVNREIPEDIEKLYKQGLKKDNLKQGEISSIRSHVIPKDIHAVSRSAMGAVKRRNKSENTKVDKQNGGRPDGAVILTKYKRIKAIKDRECKLFGQNSTANNVHLPKIQGPENEIENDDFCSSCLQTGVFLCCDTCPKSFHFACLNPPVDPDNLPSGDWSCYECRFKQRNPNKTTTGKNEKHFMAINSNINGISMFGKLLFQLRSINSKQFVLNQQLKYTFSNVHTGLHGEYQDNNMKEQLTDRQLFSVSHGQSITKFDSYNPDAHFSSVDYQELLKCYKCDTSKMGTWDHPDTERLIMKCDYCQTPWHLDCLPIPRASRKNLGSKWMCPLHTIPPRQKRKLVRHQSYPVMPLGAPNDGDIEIMLDSVPITTNIDKDLQRIWENENKYNSTPMLLENNVKLEFFDKIYKAKHAQSLQEFHQQAYLVDRMLYLGMNDMNSWFYFTLPESKKKLWDFQELCKVANLELSDEILQFEELNQLRLLKQLLESKPKKEVLVFLGLDK